MNFLQSLGLENAPSDIMLPLLSCLERRGLNLNSPDDQLLEVAMDYLAEADVSPGDVAVEYVDDHGNLITEEPVKLMHVSSSMAEVLNQAKPEPEPVQQPVQPQQLQVTDHSSWVTD